MDATLLLPTLQKLFAAVEYREASEPPPPAGGAQWAVSEDTLAAHRKACSTLLRLVSEAPSAIAPLFGQMHAFVTELSSQGRIIASEHTLLVESLLIVGCAHRLCGRAVKCERPITDARTHTRLSRVGLCVRAAINSKTGRPL